MKDFLKFDRLILMDSLNNTQCLFCLFVASFNQSFRNIMEVGLMNRVYRSDCSDLQHYYFGLLATTFVEIFHKVFKDLMKLIFLKRVKRSNRFFD